MHYNKNKDYNTYTFEKNRQEDEVETPEFLYHLTPVSKLDKILKNGLTPHSGNKMGEHPERIYLFRYRNLNVNYTLFANDLWAEEMKKQGNAQFVVNKQRNIKYALLQIDTSKLNEGFKIFGDPNLNRAVWTFDNIPPKAITVLTKEI